MALDWSRREVKHLEGNKDILKALDTLSEDLQDYKEEIIKEIQTTRSEKDKSHQEIEIDQLKKEIAGLKSQLHEATKFNQDLLLKLIGDLPMMTPYGNRTSRTNGYAPNNDKLAGPIAKLP